MHTCLFNVVGPSAIDEIKEDGNKLKTPEQRIGRTSVDASATEANAAMTAHAAGQFQN